MLQVCILLPLTLLSCSYAYYIPSANCFGIQTLKKSANVITEGVPADVVSAKSVTKEIMSFFAQQSSDIKFEQSFKKRLMSDDAKKHIDGLHVVTILFQSARTKRQAKNILPISFMLEKLSEWDRIWSERDISTFVYGIRSLECIEKIDGELIKFGSKKILESPVQLSSRAIGNALYGLQEITSDTSGAIELCAALATKISLFNGDLNGQDIGIGLYGLQGMSADSPEVRRLVAVLAEKISKSESELDAQALSNALYGLQVLLILLLLFLKLLYFFYYCFIY
jgi:hypothetical protein